MVKSAYHIYIYQLIKSAFGLVILLDFGGFPWLPQGFRLTFPTQRIVACDGV
jgi:hypothetical protein